jgi:hypothetical protein
MTDENLAIPQSTLSVYSPSAIVNIIQNVYVTPQEKKLIGLRGVYNQKGKVNYKGFWYDELKDESSDNSITLIVPNLIRNQLTHNKTIEIICYITKKAEKNGSITLQANLTDLLTQTQNKYSAEEIRAIEIQQQKSDLGFRDLDSFIKKCIYDNRKPVVKILIGKTAIIQEDIKAQMGEAVALYDISFVQTSITSIPDIIASLGQHNNDKVDIIVISRGGGEDVEVLNKPELAEYCLTLKPIFVSAIAHKENVPLVEKIADKKFITPTALGQYLKEIYNNTVEDFEQSKAKLADDITKQLKTNYDKQISNLSQQLVAEKELKAKTLADKDTVYNNQIKGLNDQIKSLQAQFTLQVQEKEKLLAEKEKLLNTRIETLSREREEKDKLLSQAKGISEQYKTSIDGLQRQISSLQSGNSSTVIIAVVISIIVGLIIGFALKH